MVDHCLEVHLDKVTIVLSLQGWDVSEEDYFLVGDVVLFKLKGILEMVYDKYI